jgi:ABC-type lipoprotein export system ATPase subunit
MTASGGVPVRCVDVHQTYSVEGEDVHALAGVHLAGDAGERIALFGPSGSGKSTLLAILAGLRRPSSGSVWVGDAEVNRLSERQLLRLRSGEVGVVAQNPSRTLLPYGTVEDNILFAQRAVDRDRRRGLPAPADLLADLGLAALAGQRVGALSGGEQQRVSVAVALACAPRLLLADEPTSQLDGHSRDRVVDLLVQAGRASGATEVVVTHDPAVADACDRRVTLSEGRVVAAGRAQPWGEP